MASGNQLNQVRARTAPTTVTVRSHPRLYVGHIMIISLVILFLPRAECSECAAWGSLRVHLGSKCRHCDAHSSSH
jgi:hypothetical protein